MEVKKAHIRKANAKLLKKIKDLLIVVIFICTEFTFCHDFYNLTLFRFVKISG